MKLKNITLFLLLFSFILLGWANPVFADDLSLETPQDNSNLNDLVDSNIETNTVNQYCGEDGELALDEFWNAVSLGKVTYSLAVAGDMQTASAKVVNETGCSIPMSLSAYKMYDQDLSHQTLFEKDGLTNIVSDHTFTVNLPSCMAQIDFWYGDAPSTLVSDGNAYVTSTPPRVLTWRFIYNNGSSYWNAEGQFCSQDSNNLPPVANAGIDQTLTLPTNSTNLDGSLSTDPDGTIVSYVWTFVTGPTNIDPSDIINPSIEGLLAGTYVFSLTVTDNDSLTGSDTVTITINEDGGGNGGHPVCSDGLDNDGDGAIDYPNDEGCESANDNSEDNRRIISGGGIVRRGEGQVLGAQDTVCNFAIDTYMRRGYDNNKEQVKVLQALLNKYVGSNLKIDGFYGPKTEAAVDAFQIKYRDTILDPWNIDGPTGIFFRTSLVQAQNLECSGLNLPIPENLINWSQSAGEVPLPLPVPIPLSFNYFYGI